MDNRDIAIRATVLFSIKKSYQMVPSVLSGVLVLFSFCFVALLVTFWFSDVLSPMARSLAMTSIDIGCFILSGGMLMAFYRMALKIVDQKETGIHDLFSCFDIKLLRLFFFSMMYACAVGLGLLLFVMPGIYLLLRWALTPYVIADGNICTFDAMRRSWALTSGMTLRFLGFWTAVTLIRLTVTLLIMWLCFIFPAMFFDLGMLEHFSLIGWPLSLPIGMISTATLYRKFSKKLPRVTAMVHVKV